MEGTLINEYRVVEQVGAGAYGLVYHGLNTLTGQYIAIKAIAKQQDKSYKKQSDHLSHILPVFAKGHTLQGLRALSLKRLAMVDGVPCPFIKEVSIHLQVHDHPNVITIHQILDSSIAVFIVMDYFPESDLFVNIVDKQIYSSTTMIKRVFTQLIDVISYCHSKHIYHCDIKPENIMCAEHGNKLVIGDFGLAVKSKYIQSKTCIGSSYYMPPERLSTLNHGLTRGEYPAEKGDLWSLAVILINLCCIRNPWLKACEQDATYAAFLHDPQVLKKILDINDELYGILRDCFKEEPEDRISLFELRERVVRCHGFTSKGPLSVADSFEDDECAVPDISIRMSESVSVHLKEYADYLKGCYKMDDRNLSIMTNNSFNMNVV